MHTLERYVGRSIRLHEPAYRDLVRQSKLDEDVLENYFLVSLIQNYCRLWRHWVFFVVTGVTGT